MVSRRRARRALSPARRMPAPVTNEAALDLIVAWHGEPIGHLTHDGFEWRWMPTEERADAYSADHARQVAALHRLAACPKGWLEVVLKDKDERAVLRSGKRYMSNITIVERRANSRSCRATFCSRLDEYTKDGVFTGTYAGPGRGEITDGFERNLARYLKAAIRRVSPAFRSKRRCTSTPRVYFRRHGQALHPYPQASRDERV